VASQRNSALPLAHLRSAGGGCSAMRRCAQLFAILVLACRPASREAPAGDARPAATRIVSLIPSVTELLFALGAGDRVVGRTVYCLYPPAARAVPSVGDGLNPSVEAIAARHPDLVLLYRSPQTETAARQLESLGIPTMLLRDDRLEDVARLARALGRAAGRPAPGDSIGRVLEAFLAAPVPAPRASVAFVVWDAPPIVIGRGSYLDELAARAGMTNVFRDLDTPSATVSLETIAARDPDWIAIVRDSANAPRPAWAERREWRTVRAVREGRFLVLPAELFGQASPRAPEAVAFLRQLLR
jgi:iron complex transport system substrate-binding protein